MQPIFQKDVRVITSIEEDSINKYFKDISKIKLLTAEEEKILAKQVRNGDNKAKERFINANLRFVISVAKQYQNKGVLLLDLINEGNIGLIHAVETFDETKGFRFISYAVYWIRQAILAALTRHSHTIYIPFNQYYLHSRIKKILEDQKSKEGKITEEEIANILEIDKEDVSKILKNSEVIGYTVSLNSTVSPDDDKLTLIDTIKNENIKAPDSDLIQESMKRDLNKVLSKVLDERERQVIILNYGLGENFGAMSFEEIGDRMNLTKECIRQIKEKAIRKLRLYGGKDILRQYI